MTTFATPRNGNVGTNADVFVVTGIAAISAPPSDATEVSVTYTLTAVGAGTNADSGGPVLVNDSLLTTLIEAVNSAIETAVSRASGWSWSVSHTWDENE